MIKKEGIMKNTRFTAICMAMVMGVSLVGCGGNQGAGNGGNGAGSAKAEAGTDNKENTGAMVTVGPIRIPRPRVQRTLPR